jgi:hypothetical protein
MTGDFIDDLPTTAQRKIEKVEKEAADLRKKADKRIAEVRRQMDKKVQHGVPHEKWTGS